MPYESNTGLNVSNHYGPRDTGNQEGVIKTEGAKNQATVNYDGEAFDFKVYIPAGAVVTNVITDFATGAVSAATVGAVDISGADGTAVNNVDVPLGGLLTVTGPTAGYVIVEYMHVS